MSEKEIWKKFIKNKFSYYDNRKINDDGNVAKIFKEVAPFIKNGDLTQFMNELFAECQKPTSIYVGTKRIPEPYDITVRSYNKDALKDLIRNLLRAKNPQPIGIGYCSKVLANRNYIGRKPDPEYDMQMVSKDDQECGSHASVLIGMKNIGGKCHYLLRNTWGDRCDYDWECRFNAKKEAVGIWIDEDALLNNLGDMTYIRNKDFACMAKTPLGEDIFEMDLPNYPINKRDFIYIFDRKELIFVEMDNDRKISFLFGKDSSSLYDAYETDERDIKIPIKVSLSIRKKNLSLKMACVPNGPNKSNIASSLKKIIDTQF